jgi:hypothetical protein
VSIVVLQTLTQRSFSILLRALPRGVLLIERPLRVPTMLSTFSARETSTSKQKE